MPTVAIQKNQETGTSGSIFDELARIGDRIRQRAYELFESRGASHGSDVDDWLNAENELVCCPESQLTENENNFEVRVKLPGFQPSDIQVTALSDELIIKGEATRRHQENREGVEVAEFGQKTFLRRFNFSQPVDMDGVTAELNGDELHLTIPKASTGHSVNVAGGSDTQAPAESSTATVTRSGTGTEDATPKATPKTASASGA
jgi:HSP20 family protein